MVHHVAFKTILAELRRALAAARRYENLRYGRSGHERLAAPDIPRRIFDEFYDFSGGSGTRSNRFEPQCVLHLRGRHIRWRFVWYAGQNRTPMPR
jgi:hypothetical protein